MNEYRIMIVDDESDILNLLEKALNIEGFYNIIKTDNGIDAVNICKQNQPDIIILDIMLPGIDGYEVCKQIRQLLQSFLPDSLIQVLFFPSALSYPVSIHWLSCHLSEYSDILCVCILLLHKLSL